MIFRTVTLYLLLASSNASLLRGFGGVENKDEKQRRLGSGSGDDTGCGQKLSEETMIAFGLDPNMNCTALSKTDYDCVPLSQVPQLSVESTCDSSEDCDVEDESCFYVPNQVGPVGLPIAHCNTREGAAADVDGITVDLNVPKQICEDIAI